MNSLLEQVAWDDDTIPRLNDRKTFASDQLVSAVPPDSQHSLEIVDGVIRWQRRLGLLNWFHDVSLL